jgi:hypothetical protein
LDEKGTHVPVPKSGGWLGFNSKAIERSGGGQEIILSSEPVQIISHDSGFMEYLKKIISGGQTGVDQSALNAAIALNLECGGWCPPGRICEAGIIPDHFPLDETPTDRSEAAQHVPRSLRTEWNVRDADATLMILPSDMGDDRGISWTIQCIQLYRKESLHVDPHDAAAVSKIKEWIASHKIELLNVAGPSEKTYPGIGSLTYKLMFRTLG